MSTTTTNYKLIKPELTDPADITELNPNWDVLDNQLKALQESMSGFNSETLGIERGGTGATTAKKARENLGITPGNIGAADSTLSNVDLSKLRVGVSDWADYANYPGVHECSNKDLNTIKTSGLYFGYTGMTNAAFNEISVLEVIQYSNDWLIQRHTRLTDGRMYWRCYSNGNSWSAWEVINTSKHPGYQYSTTNITAGSTKITTGAMYLVYE
jgi:hypothetical protein